MYCELDRAPRCCPEYGRRDDRDDGRAEATRNGRAEAARYGHEEEAFKLVGQWPRAGPGAGGPGVTTVTTVTSRRTI